MVLYKIGGLGADERVFDNLIIETANVSIKWIKPNINEPLEEYVLRLSDQIDKNQDYGILGVSFGGIIALELNKILEPNFLILVSSVSCSNELPFRYGRNLFSKLIEFFPKRLIKPPSFIMHYMFSAVDKHLLDRIVKDTWALRCILQWDGNDLNVNYLRIHGTSDRLIPLSGDAIKIRNGGHFMVVDKANEISKIINEFIQ